MARNKQPPKPLFALRHDFAASLDNVCHEAIMLLQAVDMSIRQEGLPPAIKDILSERSKAMRAALMQDD